ncbi:MAG: hypothetical protein NT159_08245 [Proteobacteria bacterium]|nr:hypothetical protein [Pseudomonadota bacterium]
MKVRIFVGARAYACISTDTKSLDVQLSAGKPAAASLRESAKDMREEAARFLERAALIEAAAELV